jgi:hypothetical protein
MCYPIHSILSNYSVCIGTMSYKCSQRSIKYVSYRTKCGFGGWKRCRVTFCALKVIQIIVLLVVYSDHFELFYIFIDICVVRWNYHMKSQITSSIFLSFKLFTFCIRFSFLCLTFFIQFNPLIQREGTAQCSYI